MIVMYFILIHLDSGLLNGIEGLIKHFDGDVLVSESLKKFKCVLAELMNYLSVSIMYPLFDM